MLADLLPVPPDETWRFGGKLTLNGYQLTVVIDERDPEDYRKYTSHRWSFALSRQDG